MPLVKNDRVSYNLGHPPDSHEQKRCVRVDSWGLRECYLPSQNQRRDHLVVLEKLRVDGKCKTDETLGGDPIRMMQRLVNCDAHAAASGEDMGSAGVTMLIPVGVTLEVGRNTTRESWFCLKGGRFRGLKTRSSRSLVKEYEVLNPHGPRSSKTQSSDGADI